MNYLRNLGLAIAWTGAISVFGMFSPSLKGSTATSTPPTNPEQFLAQVQPSSKSIEGVGLFSDVSICDWKSPRTDHCLELNGVFHRAFLATNLVLESGPMVFHGYWAGNDVVVDRVQKEPSPYDAETSGNSYANRRTIGAQTLLLYKCIFRGLRI